jgi:hypothetical protein
LIPGDFFLKISTLPKIFIIIVIMMMMMMIMFVILYPAFVGIYSSRFSGYIFFSVVGSRRTM